MADPFDDVPGAAGLALVTAMMSNDADWESEVVARMQSTVGAARLWVELAWIEAALLRAKVAVGA